MSEPSGTYTPTQAYALLAFLIAATLSLELSRLPLIVLVDPVRQSFKVGDLEISLLLGALSSVPFVAMSLIGGFLSDRLSRKLLLGVAVAFWFSGAIISATAPDFTWLAAGRVLIGIGAGMKLPIAMTWINDAFPPARRGRAIGAFFVVLGTGPSLAVILSGFVQSWAQTGVLSDMAGMFDVREPWRITIAVLALPSIAVLLVLPLLHDRRLSHAAARATGGANTNTVGFGLMALLVGGAALIQLVDAGNLAWVSTIFIRDFGFDTARAGAVFGVATLIAGLAGPLIGGTVGDVLFQRFGQYGRVMLAGCAALAIAPLLTAYLLGSPNILIAALTLSGVCTVAALSLSYVTVQAVLPPRVRGLGTGITSAVTTLVGSAGPTLVALVATGAASGQGAGSLTVAVAIVSGIAAVLAALLYFLCAFALRRDQTFGASAV